MVPEPAAEPESTLDQPLARPGDLLPGLIPLLPVAARPFFPGQAVPLLMDASHWSSTLKAVARSEHKILGVVLVRGDRAEAAGPGDFYPIGTACRVHRVHEQEGMLQVLVECLQRFRLEGWVSRETPFSARVEYFPEEGGPAGSEIKAYAMAVINTIKELLPLNPLYVEELRMFLDRFGPEDPSHLADFAASLTTSTKEQLQEVLEAVDLLPRMERVLVLLNNELELARSQQKIRRSVEERMQKQQREFFLREQLKAIQKELGIAKDDRTAELDRFRERLSKLTLSEEAGKRVAEEMDKMAILETGSPEYAVTRNYLDWISVLPWGLHSADKLDLKRARRVLDRDHYGLEDVKTRILEFLAVGIHKGEISGSIILLVGPPGVGKTSIGRSIADALGRRFYRFSVGGIRDEAEIKGHRRTYIGAMPGKFIQAMKQAGTANPVILLDEIDKIGASYHGDPASALLEVLDPEQNVDFLDHYLDLRFDLSKVLFVCTANQLDAIPAPLLDRMEVIPLSGYIAEEKLQIARKYLLPRQIERAGLPKSTIKMDSASLRALIDGYARDAGVRRLEKQLGKIVRKGAVKLLEDVKPPIRVGAQDLKDYLGSPVFRDERRLSGPGVVTGLAWTAMGGATLSIEAAATHSFNRGFKLTGQLGEVMKESAEIAYGYVVGHAEALGADPAVFERSFIHLHVPAGATPKDGPSAGITMASALLSLARNEPVRRIAMTGEITLTGEVFPIGGVREKLIAARRAGIREILLPEDNRGEFEEVPAHVRRGLSIHFVGHFLEVVPHLFGGAKGRPPRGGSDRRGLGEPSGPGRTLLGAGAHARAEIRHAVAQGDPPIGQGQTQGLPQLGVVEDRIAGAPGGGRELAGGDGHQPAAQPGGFQDAASETVPTGLPCPGHVIEPGGPGSALLRGQHAVEDHRGHLGQHAAPGGGSHLVVHHPQLIALLEQLEHGEQEVLAPYPIEPTGAQHHRVGAGLEQVELAGQLGLPIDVLGDRLVLLPVGALGAAIEDKVRREVDDGHTAPREGLSYHPGGLPVDPLGQVPFPLCPVDQSIGRRVDQGIGPDLRDETAQPRTVGEIHLGAELPPQGGGHHLPQGGEGALQLPARLAIGPQ